MRERGELLELVRLERRRQHAGRGDVEGHAAAARPRPGDDRRPSARCCSTSRRARSTQAGGARSVTCWRSCAPRCRGAAEHALAQRGRAGLRPRGDHRPRPRGRPARRRSWRARGGVEVETGARRAPCGASRAGARTSRGSSPSWSPPASRSTACRSGAPRWRTSTSTRWRTRRVNNGILIVAQHALQEALRRRVLLVVLAADRRLRRPLRLGL